LALLVDLEACWENLRTAPLGSSDAPRPTQQGLHGKQKAYDAFRAKLAGYNRRYRPAHVPELLLNTPARLGKWCRAMRALYLWVEHDPRGRCPVHLLEKAYRWADRVAARTGQGRLSRSAPPGTIGEAIRVLEALERWCDTLTGVTPPR
jgi:hypothetical protein